MVILCVFPVDDAVFVAWDQSSSAIKSIGKVLVKAGALQPSSLQQNRKYSTIDICSASLDVFIRL
jgi:hypothetical protein